MKQKQPISQKSRQNGRYWRIRQCGRHHFLCAGNGCSWTDVCLALVVDKFRWAVSGAAVTASLFSPCVASRVMDTSRVLAFNTAGIGVTRCRQIHLAANHASTLLAS